MVEVCCDACRDAKPKTICNCRCGGRYHAMNNVGDERAPYERTMNSRVGGEAGEVMTKLLGKSLECTCGKKITIGQFLGYPHDGGYADKNGDRWWLYVHCKKCNYDWALHKLENRILFK